MGIFSLLIVIPATALYGMFGVLCLKALRIQTNVFTLVLFVASGIFAGITAIVIYGFLFADQHGQLKGFVEVIGLFVFSVFFALLVSVLVVKFAIKYNTALKRDRANRAAP